MNPALLATLGLTEAHVYDAPCGCVLATPSLPIVWRCAAHDNRWRYLACYRLHMSGRDEWCGPVVDGCVVERAA